MATLHGNWIPDLQQFFLWGETWQKADPTALTALTGDAEAMPALGKQPYQLDQKTLASSFQKSEELDLSWMKEKVGAAKKTRAKASANATGKAGEKVASGTGAKKGSKKPKTWLTRVVVLPTKIADEGV